jgi:hypothetical protein
MHAQDWEEAVNKCNRNIFSKSIKFKSPFGKLHFEDVIKYNNVCLEMHFSYLMLNYRLSENCFLKNIFNFHLEW